jgi:hypothetical protein
MQSIQKGIKEPGIEMMEESRKKLNISWLIEEIKSFPLKRGVEHCGGTFYVSPFDIYARCPQCMSDIKLRSFSGVTEIEDIFDAVFEWIDQPEALLLVKQRQKAIKEDKDTGQL